MSKARAPSKRRETGMLNMPRGRVYYESVGEGPTLILIHAAIADRRMWDRELGVYTPNRRIVRYDVRGFGRSQPATRSYSDAMDLSSLMDLLKIPTATLVGASHGGQIALDFALRFPQRTDRLILVGAGLGLFDPTRDPSAQKSASALEEEFGKLAAAWKRGRTEPCLNALMALFAPAQRGEIREFVRNMMRDNLKEIVTDSSARHASFRISEGSLTRIHTPTLVLIGERDHPAIRWSSAQLYRSLPSARYRTLTEADHLPNLSAPDDFDRAVTGFLSSGG